MKQRILFVDDEPRMREMVTVYLEERDYSVRGAGTAEEAMRLMDQMPFDLVVLDVLLAEENGLQLLEFLKLNHPDKPFLVYTGAAYNDETVAKARSRGAFACVSKASSLDSLLSTMRNALAAAAQTGRRA